MKKQKFVTDYVLHSDATLYVSKTYLLCIINYHYTPYIENKEACSNYNIKANLAVGKKYSLNISRTSCKKRWVKSRLNKNCSSWNILV